MNLEKIFNNKQNYQEKLTVIIVTFHSGEIIENLINQLEQSIKILIIENSKDFSLKSKLEEKYSNVEVIISHNNIGVGAAINVGLKKVKTKYSLQLSPDVEVNKKMIQITPLLVGGSITLNSININGIPSKNKNLNKAI